MPAKISTHVFKGMSKDINVANSSNEYLFDAYNLRFNQLDDNTLMSIVNERGNENILDIGTSTEEYVSHYIVGNYIVVFTYKEVTVDQTTKRYNCIYRIEITESNTVLVTLFDECDLNIRPEKPLEFTSYFEAEGVIKIYWVDGVNQLRFMNIMEELKNIADPGETPIYRAYTDSNDFNTTPELQLEETVTVEQIDGNGQFPAGVIQYALTYVNKLGAESNTFYTTKLHSIQFKNRAAGPQEQVNCAFRITINNVDTSFDYIRCYQLLRTSLDAQPTCLILNEVPANTETVTIYDTNVGATYDSAALLFQKYPIIPYTLDQKSNTLFLGNLDEEVFELSDSDIATVRTYFNQEVEYTSDDIISVENNKQAGTYPVLRFGNANLETYECEENNGYIFNPSCDIIRTFKSRETYRIGVQLQNEFGVWSEPIYLKDIEVESKQHQSNNIVNPISLIFDGIKAGTLTLNENYKRFRFLMVNPSATDRSIFTQGIVVPTIYELSDRIFNAPFSYSSWFLRPFNSGIVSENNDLISNTGPQSEIQAINLSGLTPDWYTNTPQYGSGAGSVSDTDQFPNLPVNIKGNIAFDRIEPMWIQVQLRFYIEKINCVINYTSIVDQYICRLPASANDGSFILNQNLINTVYTGIMNAISGAGDFYQCILYNDDHDRPYHGESRTKDNNYIYNNIYNFLQQPITVPALGNSTKVYVFDFDSHNSIDISNATYDGVTYKNYMIPSSQTQNPISSVVEHAGLLCDFRIDHSILNLYSPEIDSNYYIIHNNKLELDLVGYNPINNILDNVYIELSSSPADAHGHLLTQTNYHRFNTSNFAPDITRFLLSDTAVVQTTDDNGDIKTAYGRFRTGDGFEFAVSYHGYAVYPWHRTTSLNNDINTDNNQSAQYTKKIFGKSWISHTTNYFQVPYKYKKSGASGEIVSGCECNILKVCNQTNSMILFKQNEKIQTYIPNVDIARTFINKAYNIKINKPTDFSDLVTYSGAYVVDDNDDYSLITQSDDPIQIKYKSDTHVLIPVDYTIGNFTDTTPGGSGDTYYNCYQIFTLPSLSNVEPAFNPQIYYPLWDNNTVYRQSHKQIRINGNLVTCDTNYLFTGELYKDTSNTRYGGPIIFNNQYDRENPVLINNIFIPITESYNIDSIDENVITTTYGDTWYGRWDCLKTQEMTDQDQQSIHDYASVMIESHINLNGRYDSYRNFYDQTLVNAQNANKFNDVYNQMDTFWSYKVIPNYLKTTYYPNQVTWSLTKQTGALVDEWTKVTAANVQELDGNKGPINKILNYRDSLFVFQDRCISQIKYNEQTQMTTTEGVPVEISNSQKVTGIVKVYDGTGCVNKWSIASDANGVFFVDNVNESMMWLGGSQDTPLVNLTNSKAFTQFMKANNSFDVWNPKDFSNFVTFIDSAHKDVYFVNKDKCLCFSLALQEFTSFYSYERTFGMFNINNDFYSLYAPYSSGSYGQLSLYRNFTGTYNKIYNKFKPTQFIFIDHGESFLTDKTFTNINYIQDAYDINNVVSDDIEDYDGVNYSYEPEITFDSLKVWTPFQDTTIKGLKESELVERKFRTWGIQIPRDVNTVDRIRNNWAKFKFIFSQPDYNEDDTVKQGVTNPRDIKIELMNINIQSIE